MTWQGCHGIVCGTSITESAKPNTPWRRLWPHKAFVYRRNQTQKTNECGRPLWVSHCSSGPGKLADKQTLWTMQCAEETGRRSQWRNSFTWPVDDPLLWLIAVCIEGNCRECVCVCVCVCVCTCMRACVRARARVVVCVRVCVSARERMCVRTHARFSQRERERVRVCVWSDTICR